MLCTESASMGISAGPWLTQIPVIWIHSYTHTQIYIHYNILYMVCTDIFCKHDTPCIYSQIAFHTIFIISHYFI